MNKNHLIYNCTIFLFTAILLLSSCASSEKLVASGDYDQAIDVSLRKLKKKKKKDKDVIVLERAFQKATKRDMDQIVFLKKEGQPENWEEINRLSKKIAHRQEKMKPLLPLYIESEGNRMAAFKFVNVEELILESKEKAAAFLYASGLQSLEKGRNGDKFAARNAYEQFYKIENYFYQYKDYVALKEEARAIGINKVLFRLENNSFSILPLNFEYELARMDFDDLADEWIDVYMDEDDASDFDYEILLNLRDVEASPQVQDSRNYQERNREQDGFTDLRDGNGNYVLDSLGGRVQVPNYVDYLANVRETRQLKEVLVGGQLEFYDLREGGKLIYYTPVTARAVFENLFATFDGDREALSSDSIRKLNNRPEPFPTDRDMLLLAAESLQPILEDKIWDNRRYLTP